MDQRGDKTDPMMQTGGTLKKENFVLEPTFNSLVGYLAQKIQNESDARD